LYYATFVLRTVLLLVVRQQYLADLYIIIFCPMPCIVTDSVFVCHFSDVRCPLSDVRCPAVGVVTTNH